MANNWNLGVVAHLDGTKSKNQLNQDIQALKRVLDNVELKATLDPNQVKNLENQLNKLQVSLTDITIPQSVLDGLVTQINNALQGININNINFNPSGVGNAGRQIGEIISKEAANAIGDVTSKVIGQGFTVSPKMSQKVQSELENIVKDWTNGKGKISSITIDTKTDFNEQTLENIEHLKSATVQYSNELGQVITKTLKYKQIGVNTFANGETEAIKGWVESASTYKATLESTSKSTNNFVNQQKKAVTDLTNQVNQIYKSAIDPNASKPIKNSGNLSNLENQYNDIITAIGKMGSASEATFTDERNSVNTLISDLKIVVREYKNAETAATSMRSKDIGTVKAIKTNELDEFIAKIQNSKVPMKEMKSEIASLKTSLSNITDTDSLTAYLNQFDIASSKFKSLKEQFANNGSIANVIFDPAELDKQGRIYVKKVNNTIEKTKSEIESKLRNDKKNRWTDIQITGVEKANGQIKSLTVQATNAAGAFKELRFEAQKIATNSKKGYQTGLVQTSEVKTLKGNMSQMRQIVQTTLDGLKSKWQEQGVLVGDFKTKVEQLQTSLASVGSKGELNNLKSQMESLKTQASQIAEVNKIQHSLDVGDYDAQIETIKRGFVNLTGSADEAETHVQGLRTALKAMHDATDDNGRLTAEKNYQLALEKTHNQLTIAKAKAKEYVDVLKVNKLRNDIQDWLKNNTAATKEAKDAMKSYLDELSDVAHISQTTFNSVKSGMDNWDTQMRLMGKLGKSPFETFKEGAKSFASWTISSGSVMEVWNAVKQGVGELKDLSDILTEISKTSNLTKNQLKELGDTAFESASKYGESASTYLTSIQEMYRAGFDNAEEMAELVTLAKKAGDMETTSSVDYVTATNAAYDYKGSVEDLTKVLDGQNYITNNAAVSMQDMADATSEAASIASQYGVEVEELSALIAVAVSKTRESGSEVGTALKALFINLQDTTSKPIKEAFDAVGISMTEMVNGSEQLKTPIELIKELSIAFNSLPEGDIKRANILNDIGGKHHANILSSVLSDLDAYNQMLELYSQGMGSAEKEAQKSANNWTGTWEKIKNSWNDLIQNFANTDVIVGALNVLNDFIGALDKLGAVGTLALGGGLFAGIKNVGQAKMWAC